MADIVGDYGIRFSHRWYSFNCRIKTKIVIHLLHILPYCFLSIIINNTYVYQGRSINSDYSKSEQNLQFLCVVQISTQPVSIGTYSKVPKFSDAKDYALIYLKFKQKGQTFAYFIKKMQME